MVVLYDVLLDSGMRIRHVVELLNTWDEGRLKARDGYYIYALSKKIARRRVRTVPQH